MKPHKGQWYHGTSASFSPGDHLMPAEMAHVPELNGNGHIAWATRDPMVAADYARQSAAKTGATPKVMKVRPLDGEEPHVTHTNEGHLRNITGSKNGWLVEGKAWEAAPEDEQHREDMLNLRRSHQFHRERIQAHSRAVARKRNPPPPRKPLSPEEQQTVNDILKALNL